MAQIVIRRYRSWFGFCLVFLLYHYFTCPHGEIDRERTNLPLCPEIPPDLHGPINPSTIEVDFEETSRNNPGIHPGGNYVPSDCRATYRTAVIVPFRGVQSQLKVFLANLLPIFRRQQLNFQLFFVTSPPSVRFNRAKLMNVGFAEATNFGDFECFIFHDVDLLPEDDRILYKCNGDQMRHLSVHVHVDNDDCLSYNEQERMGVTIFSRNLFHEVNGFSNNFWQWNGEGEEMALRLQQTQKSVFQSPGNISRYRKVTCDLEEGNAKCSQGLLQKTKQRYRRDGLFNLKYRLVKVEEYPLFVLITADTMEADGMELIRAVYPHLRTCWQSYFSSTPS